MVVGQGTRLVCGRKILRPKIFQLFRAEVGENFSIRLDHRRERLAGELDHFIHGRAVGNHVERLIFDAALVEPALPLVAPAAIRFDEETGFHGLGFGFNPINLLCKRKRRVDIIANNILIEREIWKMNRFVSYFAKFRNS